jgi:rare lipoprotein A
MRRCFFHFTFLAAALLAAGCTTFADKPTALPPVAELPPAQPEAPVAEPRAVTITASQGGFASWYGKGLQGHRTASGERFDMHAMTAAHRTLPFGAWVRVTAVGTRRSVVVRVNDRGPFVKDRVIDLSYAAASALGIAHSGRTKVELVRVQRPSAAA